MAEIRLTTAPLPGLWTISFDPPCHTCSTSYASAPIR